MSLRARPAPWLAFVGAALVLLTGASPASAVQRIESFALPSLKGNVDVETVQLNRITTLRATVMLPDGYDEQPDADWPVLYLLNGVGDNSEGWAAPGTGNVRALASGFGAIVVMPESGRGYLMDWWRGGARNGPNWSRYTLEEVIPAIESRYRVRPGRQFHSIAGISMGGYGALLLGGLLPSYFGSIISMSGLVDSQNPEAYALLPSSAGAQSYESIWGPVDRAYATVHNPIKTVVNVAKSRIYLSTGNGVPDWRFPFKQEAWTVGAAIEVFTLAQNIRYDAQLRNVGAPHVLKLRAGVHDWPYWRRELPVALAWNPFAAPPVTDSAQATSWTYKTMAPHGNAWGFGYQFAEPTTNTVTFQRSGAILKGYGSGTVQINPGTADADASGEGTKPQCAFTATLPFQRVIPPGC